MPKIVALSDSFVGGWAIPVLKNLWGRTGFSEVAKSPLLEIDISTVCSMRASLVSKTWRSAEAANPLQHKMLLWEGEKSDYWAYYNDLGPGYEHLHRHSYKNCGLEWHVRGTQRLTSLSLYGGHAGEFLSILSRQRERLQLTRMEDLHIERLLFTDEQAVQLQHLQHIKSLKVRFLPCQIDRGPFSAISANPHN